MPGLTGYGVGPQPGGGGKNSGAGEFAGVQIAPGIRGLRNVEVCATAGKQYESRSPAATATCPIFACLLVFIVVKLLLGDYCAQLDWHGLNSGVAIN